MAMAVTYYHSDAIRTSLAVVFLIVVGLKLSESWMVGEEGWLADYYPDDEAGNPGYHFSQAGGEESHSLQAFFKHRDRPTTNGPRCDACRAVAYRLDKAFDFAESHISTERGVGQAGLEELSAEEVATIASYICSKKTFSDVKPFKYESVTRLLIHGIETPLLYKKGTKGSDSLSSARERAVDWPQRIENHCKYLVTERLHSKEVYELWLRTSAAAYQDYSTFESFLCFGEYVFGDCVGRTGPQTEDDYWPGGDDKEPVGEPTDAGSPSDETDPEKSSQAQALIEFETTFREWYEETRAGVKSAGAPLARANLLPLCLSVWATIKMVCGDTQF